MPRVEVLTTLKSEGRTWAKGEQIKAPFPQVIRKELQLNRGTVRLIPDPLDIDTMQEVVEVEHLTEEKPDEETQTDEKPKKSKLPRR